MNVKCDHSVLASHSIVRPRCSGSSNVLRRLSGVPNPVHVRPTSWYSQEWALSLVFLVALVAFPAAVSAAPPTPRSQVNIGIDGTFQRRQDPNSQGNSNNNMSSSGSMSVSVWVRHMCSSFLVVSSVWSGCCAHHVLLSGCSVSLSFFSFALTASDSFRHHDVRRLFVRRLHPSARSC